MIYLLKKNIKIKKLSNKLNYIKLRIFKIKKKLKLITFKLILFKEMKVHPVFYKSFLEPAPQDTPQLKLIKIN